MDDLAKAIIVFVVIVISIFVLAVIFLNEEAFMAVCIGMPIIAFPLGHFLGRFFSNRERKNGRY